MCFSGSLSDSLGRPPQFKTRRHKLGVGTHERLLGHSVNKFNRLLAQAQVTTKQRVSNTKHGY